MHYEDIQRAAKAAQRSGSGPASIVGLALIAVAAWHALAGAPQPGAAGQAIHLAWSAAALLAASFAGLVVAGLAFSAGPRRLRRWLRGSPPPLAATTDQKSGYYGLRMRLLDAPRVEQLPLLKLRYRQSRRGDVLLRIVNYEAATALERTLGCDEPGAWRTAQIDLRAMVRQTDPDFFGDEVHLTGDPESALEVDDVMIVKPTSNV